MDRNGKDDRYGNDELYGQGQGAEVHFPAGSLFPDIHTEGDAGVPYMGRGLLPNDGPETDDEVASADISGDLATSGLDDQLRGDTVTGLGIEHVERPERLEGHHADTPHSSADDRLRVRPRRAD